MKFNPITKYKLRITCLTYNHATYIDETMDGFCMQNTNFPFVAIIIDDASTDGEQEVIRKYLEDHFNMANALQDENDDGIRIAAIHKENPNCHFLVILLKYNFYSIKKTKSSLYRGWHENVPYIAMCEGDDYWTDPNKLQQQVDFLDSHPEYSMCFHNVNIRAEKGRKWYDVFGELEDRDYTGFENLMKWSVPTCSIVFRSELGSKKPKNDKFRMGDNVLVLTCSKYGKIRCIPKKMGVYRLHPTSWIGGQSDKVQRYKYISHYIGLIEEFEECRDSRLYAILENQYFQLLDILRREGDKEEFERVKQDYLSSPGEHCLHRYTLYHYKMELRRFVKKIMSRIFFTNSI